MRGTRASMNCRSLKPTESSIGLWEDGLTTILD
jgi:hypothetical protein